MTRSGKIERKYDLRYYAEWFARDAPPCRALLRAFTIDDAKEEARQRFQLHAPGDMLRILGVVRSGTYPNDEAVTVAEHVFPRAGWAESDEAHWFRMAEGEAELADGIAPRKKRRRIPPEQFKYIADALGIGEQRLAEFVPDYGDVIAGMPNINLITRADAARYLEVSVARVDQYLRKERFGTVLRFRGRCYLRRDNVDAFVEKRKKEWAELQERLREIASERAAEKQPQKQARRKVRRHACTEGVKPKFRESRPIVWVRHIVVRGSIDVLFKQGDTPAMLDTSGGADIIASFVGDKMILDHKGMSHAGDRVFMFGKGGGQTFVNGTSFSPLRNGKSRVEITLPELSAFTLQGCGDAVLSCLDCPNMEIEIQGAGTVKGIGRVGNLEVTVKGAGNVDASALLASCGILQITGVGGIAAAVQSDVYAAISGIGNITVYGNPLGRRNGQVTGFGNVRYV